MDKLVHEYFTYWDWAVIIGYLVLTTVVGHAMRGKQGTIRDFFLGGRSMPWPAVCGSIIATEISGVTFIGVAGGLFALNGNFTYLLWGIGSIMGRVIVAWVFVPKFYEEEIYSPYDYMGRRIGKGVKKLATVVFTLGSILGQSVRVLVAAIPLKIVTGMSIEVCIVCIGLFAIGWTLMGGMRTVIWTDVMQFCLFTFGGLFSLGFVVFQMDGGWMAFWERATELGRTVTWDDRWGFESHLQFTLWVAILAVPFQNLTAFGVDQLNAQRMFCCKTIKDARKALVFSGCGQLLTLLMLLVGASLVVHYDKNPFTPAEGAVVMNVDPAGKMSNKEQIAAGETALREASRKGRLISNQGEGGEVTSNVVAPVKRDYVFPMWIVTVLPVGLSGLILAGVFAAAISSLDSILAALSQTTLSLIYHPETKTDEELEKLNLVSKSRRLVVIWGIALTSFTILMERATQGTAILPLAFGMTTYAMGPMLGMFFGALTGKASFRGLCVGVVLSFLFTMFMRTDVWGLMKDVEPLIEWLKILPTYVEQGEFVTARWCYAWIWPITTLITLGCGLLISPKRLKR